MKTVKKMIRFGVGTRVYWHFLVFIIVTNAILALVSKNQNFKILKNQKNENTKKKN